MCGIVGYATHRVPLTVRTIISTLLNGLKKVEYRGYDSAGLCIDHVPRIPTDSANESSSPSATTTTTTASTDPATTTPASTSNINININNNNNTPCVTSSSVSHGDAAPGHVADPPPPAAPSVCPTDAPMLLVRSIGNIDMLQQRVFDSSSTAQVNLDAVLPSAIGISHTRWATHGQVNERNCHPQQSNHGEFTIVHNGIMTNNQIVKKFLLDAGYTFSSDTDTEVMCVLAEYLYTQRGVHDFVDLSARLCRIAEGACAMLITSTHFPDELIACRRGSPLVVAVRMRGADGEVVRHHPYDTFDENSSMELFVASDSSSFAEYTSNIVYMEDNDMMHFRAGRVHFYGVGEKITAAVSREVRVLEATLESLSKGEYAHFMLKEIYEQGETVRNALRGRMNLDTEEIHLGGFTTPQVHNLRNARRLIFISCGTSLHSCLATRALMEELVGLPISVENASDFLDRAPTITRADTCVFVSQSGETADTLMALRYCRDSGALCVGLCNVVGSSISRLTDFGAHLNAGAEIGVASTKAYTSQVVLLVLIALCIGSDSASTLPRRRAIMHALSELPDTIARTLQLCAEPVRRLAAELREVSSLLILGRGYDYATALEAALKVKELSYVHTEGINSGELKHGPLALIDAQSTVLALCSNDRHFAACKAAVQQVQARKGNVVVFTNTEDDELASVAKRVIALPATVDVLQCIVNVIPFQLLAYHMALLRGNNIDCPRNLAKSVTVQ